MVSGDEETSESMGVDTIADFDLAALPKVQDWRAHRAAAIVLGLTRHSGDLDPDEPTIWRWLKHTEPDPERPHKCGHEGCEFAAKTQGTLKSHMARKHSEERPHKCGHEGCEYAGKTQGDLKSHMAAKHSE